MDREDETHMLEIAFAAQEAITARTPTRIAELLDLPLEAVAVLVSDDIGADDADRFEAAYITVSDVLHARGVPQEAAWDLVDRIANPTATYNRPRLSEEE